MPVVNTQTGVQIIVSGQGLPGPPGPSGSGGDVEALSTQGAVGSVPTSDGANGLIMTVPSGSGNVVSPGGETAGRVTKMTGANTIDETATTETELATAVTHSGIVTGNPHNLNSADTSSEPAGSIATHAALANAHHAESHTVASHSDTSATGSQLNTLVGSGTTTLHTHAHSNLGGIGTDDHHPQAHTVASHSDTTATGAQLNTLVGGGETALHSHAGGGGGEANTASNVGIDGVGVFSAKNGVDLEMRHVAPGSSKVTTTLNGQDIDVDVVPGNIAHQSLSGAGSNTHAQIDTHLANEPAAGIATHAALGDAHHSEAHAFAGAEHSSSTLANVNTKISDATIDDVSGTRDPNAHTHVEADITDLDHTDPTAVHTDGASEFGGISDDPSPPGTGRLIAETAAGVKFRVDIGNLPTGGGGESNDLANAGTGISGVATPSKVGINLQARGHAAASSKMIIAADAPNENVTYDIDPDEIPIITLNSGFEDGTDTASLLSKVDGTRTFTITPTGADFKLWVQGTKYVISSPQNVVWANTTGAHHFYFDSSGVLQTAAGPVTELDQRTKGLIASVYWDSAGGSTLLFTTERHGFQQSPDTREFLHATVAAIWSEGLGLGILSIDGTGDDEDNGHILVGDGTYYDENLRTDILDGSPQDLDPIAQIPVFWLTGTEGTPILNKRAGTNFPFLNINDAAWSSTRVPFNELTGGNWQLTETTNNDFCLFHIFGTGDVDTPVISIHGQAEYSSLSLARDGATDELVNLVLLGIAGRESVPLGTVIVQTSNTYSNTISARIVSTLDGDYVDWRTAPRVGGGTGSVNEHNQLAGRALLSNHTQYLDLTATRPLTGDLQMGLNDVVGFIQTAGTGSSASLKDFFTGALSAGHGEGGGLALQGTPTNSVDVAAGTGLLRSIDDPTDELRSIGWDLFNSGTLSVDTETYFGVQWNGGTPIVVAKGTDTWNYQNEFPLGNAIRDSTGIHLTPNPHSIGDAPGETARRFFETASISRDRKLGGLIIGETGTRNITLSAGAFWSRLNRITVAALDTSVSGSVDFYYETAPSVFAVDATRTDWPNTQYNDGTTLTTMTNGRYAVIWWYLGFDGDVVAQYGRDEYTKIADAEDEPVPNTAPLRIANHAGLVARTVFQKDASTATEIGSIFSNVFASLGVQSHPDLTNINPDDHHNQAHDLAGADHNSATLAAFNAKISDATLDDAGDSRPPDSHAFAGADHSTSNLAAVNSKISDATLDTSSASRPPNGTAGGDLNGTYPNPSVDDGADGTAIHNNVNSEISSITDKSLPTGADHLLINDAAASNAPKSVEVRNLVPVVGLFGIDTALGTATVSSLVMTHPRALRVRRIRAQFGAVTASGTYTFLLRSGANLGSLSTVGTVTVTSGNSAGASGVISVAVVALHTTVVEMTTVGTHSGTPVEKLCAITMEAELD